MKKESLVAEFESAKMHLLAELKGYSNGLDIATYYPQAEKGQPIRVATFHQASQKVLIPSDLNAIHCADFVNEGDAFQEMIIQAEQGKFDMIITPSICNFSISIIDAIAWTRVLCDHNPSIAVFFLREGINTLSNSSSIILFLLAMVADELERRGR